jgi:alpha/beta superfamily hydrolase
MTTPERRLSVQLEDVSKWQPPEGQAGQGMLLHTTRGDIQAILHQNTDKPTQKGVVWVWGAHGGFDGPADSIYGDLAEALKDEITSLRVNYRLPNALQECVMDTLAGVSYLQAAGHTDIALVGHSFGGAVVISAAPLSPLVRAVVALSSQTYGASGAGAVSLRPLLLIHGSEDTTLPVSCSEQIYRWAREPRELVIFPGAGHMLYQCKDELRDLLRRWIAEKMQNS